MSFWQLYTFGKIKLKKRPAFRFRLCNVVQTPGWEDRKSRLRSQLRLIILTVIFLQMLLKINVL